MKDGEVVYSGYAIAVLAEVAKAIQFHYEITEPSDGTFGDSSNGTWTGMIGDLVAGVFVHKIANPEFFKDTCTYMFFFSVLIGQRADMIVATLAVTLERDTVIDFTIPYYDYAGIQILTKVPEQETDLFRLVILMYALTQIDCIVCKISFHCYQVHQRVQWKGMGHCFCHSVYNDNPHLPV